MPVTRKVTGNFQAIFRQKKKADSILRLSPCRYYPMKRATPNGQLHYITLQVLEQLIFRFADNISDLSDRHIKLFCDFLIADTIK